MYNYSHDPETGGLILEDSLSEFSKEPRPVWAAELDLLGFNEFWKYDSACPDPYLWAESNFYWYRGRKVAKTNGGSLYVKPEIELLKDETGAEVLPKGSMLAPVDIAAMIAKNRLRIEALETLTVKKIYDVYRKYEKKLDCFHVAFSGGKDSIVLLDLVKRALPKTAFLVLFGDTGMEFPETYDVVDQVEQQCKQDEIAFYRAKSKFIPEESWKLFGPPSRILRWCCTVHKSVPQTLKIREVLSKTTYTELAFVGVRSSESVLRSTYDYEIDGKKIRGQKSFNAILEWSSAEIWVYIFTHNLIINEAYIKGNQRVGCVYCPMSLKTDYLKKVCYPDIIEKYEQILKSHYSDEDITNGYWCARSNGSLLNYNEQKISISRTSDFTEYVVKNPSTSLEEWLKVIDKNDIGYSVEKNPTGYKVKIPNSGSLAQKSKIGLLTSLIRKSAYCCQCQACEANCPNGSISFRNGFHIDGCRHCLECCSIQDGCLAYSSLKYPNINGGSKMQTTIDSFGSHAPKTEWLNDFFKMKNIFLQNNSLGPEQIVRFKKFLRAAKLIDNNNVTDFAILVDKIGWNSETSLGLMLSNLAYNAQFQWYIKNLKLDHKYSRQEVIEMLSSQGYSMISSKFVTSAYKRICELPFGTRLRFGETTESGRILASLTRTKPVTPSPLVVLYSLYRFAEECGGYWEFSLSRLLDFTVESAGVSPAQVFALSRDEMEAILNGLARTNPDFVTFTTTHDLELVHLAEDKTPADVLALFDAESGR